MKQGGLFFFHPSFLPTPGPRNKPHSQKEVQAGTGEPDLQKKTAITPG